MSVFAWRLLLPAILTRDAARTAVEWVAPPPVGPGHGALEAAIEWLCRTHDVTGRAGSAKSFSLLHGWQPAYPETTGYISGTLLEYARRTGGAPQLVERALQMARWEQRIQEPDGGIMEGHLWVRPRRSIVFNTGMVLHGWEDLIEQGHWEFEAAAERAARFLIDNLTPEGTWKQEYEYGHPPHTYNSRVSWALLRWSIRAGSDEGRRAARSQLDWTCDRQQPNGWFDNCVFRRGMAPSTHSIAYTMRGLLESFCLAGEQRWLDCTWRSAASLLSVLDAHPMLPANYQRDWTPAATHSCLTGTVQLGGVWLRLYQETGEEQWLRAGLKAVEQAVGRQETVRMPEIHGAIAGSFPTWGRYAPLQYPNWATKFLADGLMLYADCLTGSAAPGVGSVVPRGARPLQPSVCVGTEVERP